ncbi:MAG: (2Fe-2S) ferredoxin domain-containing protein [Chloroflexota bacterium]
MITIEVCVGSSCYLRGAPAVIERFQSLIASASAEVILKGSFCMEQCGDGVSVRIGDRLFPGVHADDVPRLYASYVQPALPGGESPAKGE